MAASADYLEYLSRRQPETLTLEERNLAKGDPILFVYDSGRACARCDEKIMLTDELFCLEVVLTTMHGDQLLTVFATSEDGDYLYAPHFFEIDCWEQSKEELMDLRRTELPMEADLAIADCSICGNGILMDEIYAQATFGELHCSRREPNGDSTHTFARLQVTTAPTVLCISCLKHMNDDIHQLWDEGVDQEGECPLGTYTRCWRYGCDDAVCDEANRLADGEDYD